MPRFNGTGPLGRGPMTGRGLGPCGRGLRRGFGTGSRRFAQVPAQQTYTKEQERADLKAEKELLEKDLKSIDERIKELENKK